MNERSENVALTTEERPWYDRIVNTLAAVVVFFIWHLAAVGAAKWLGGSQDRYFMGIVAMALALHLHKVQRK